MTQQSNAVTSDQTIPLPAYLLRQPDGIYVDLSHFPVGGGFEKFIDGLYNSGARFRGLDYHLLTELLYDYDSILDKHGIADKLRLAEDVTAFPPNRRAIYKGVKVDGAKSSAEYFFEPVSMVVVVEEPVYGKPGEDGVAPVIGTKSEEMLQSTKLDLDEFIADMWMKDVRFGIDVEAVADAISRGTKARITVAAQRDATTGSDAELVEACDVLHRDNAPKVSANGKADLRKFQNRFPQISSGARMLMKKPRILGKQGIRVSGQRIEPLLPEDNIDLLALSGPGTCVEVQEGNEYILAAADGFLSLDTASNIVSVTEMIENKDGISLKTTGDLSLAGNDFIEHGEVQEGRVVEGKNMTFRSDVYGAIVSQDGFILFDANLSGGSAKSYGGDITSNGRVFNSVIEACTGTVTLKYAESCLILGETVVIERAVNCEIVAENVRVDSAEGCGIAGKNIQIKSSGTCRTKETLVSMLLPDSSSLDAEITQLNVAIEDCNQIIEAKEGELATLKSDPEFAKYLALAARIRKEKIQLNAVQQDGWKKMSAKFAKAMSDGSRLTAEKKEQLTLVQDFLKEQAHLQEVREKTADGICCEITEVVGDTMVKSMVYPNGVAAFQKNKAGVIKAQLREQDSRHKRIFSNDTGSLNWSYELTD